MENKIYPSTCVKIKEYSVYSKIYDIRDSLIERYMDSEIVIVVNCELAFIAIKEDKEVAKFIDYSTETNPLSVMDMPVLSSVEFTRLYGYKLTGLTNPTIILVAVDNNKQILHDPIGFHPYENLTENTWGINAENNG